MKVTPTRHGKFEKHIYILCVLLPSLHFMHYRSQSSCGSKNQILSQVSIISKVIKSLHFHDFVLRCAVTELHLHCNTLAFYQGYLVMKHVTEQRKTFQFHGRFATWHLKNQIRFSQHRISEWTFCMTAGLCSVHLVFLVTVDLKS